MLWSVHRHISCFVRLGALFKSDETAWRHKWRHFGICFAQKYSNVCAIRQYGSRNLSFILCIIHLQVTNEDRLRLNQNLVNCRRALIEQTFMKKPLDYSSSGDGNFFKNTLRRLSSKKLDKLRAEQATDPIYKGFSHTYWAFSKSDLHQTLSSR